MVNGVKYKLAFTGVSGRDLTAVRRALVMDLTGQRFGNLTALRLSKLRLNGVITWECQCDCGNMTLANETQLQNQTKTSCGCFSTQRSKQRSEASTENLAGQRFGRLTVLHSAKEPDRGRAVWLCQCDCGKAK